MAKGFVKHVVEAKGFGFITPNEPGEDLFFHCHQLHGLEFGPLLREMRVTFDVEQSPRGPRAVNVRAA